MDFTPTTNNSATAADAQAVIESPQRKPPNWNNDPTRNVSRREGVERMILAALVLLALVVLFAATIAVFARR